MYFTVVFINSLFKMGSFGELAKWFKEEGTFRNVIYVIGLLLTTVGVLGIMIYYAIWRSHYFWMYEDKYTKILKEQADALANWVSTFGTLLNIAVAAAAVTLAAFLITIIIWFIFNGEGWKYPMYCAVILSVITSLICYYVIFETTQSMTEFKPDTLKAQALGDTKIEFCTGTEGYDVSIQTLEKHKNFSLKDAKKYCSGSKGTNAALATFLLLGSIIVFVSFRLSHTSSEYKEVA